MSDVSGTSGQPPKRPYKQKRHYKRKDPEEYSISYEKYTETLAMLNSDSNVYDHTPQPTASKHPNDHTKRTRINRSKRNCELRIQTFERYLPACERLDMYQLNAPTRIFNAMHVCLQSEDWKTMGELILVAIRNTKAPLLMRYRAMFLQVAMIAVLHDPFARLELAEIYMTGVLNCKSLDDIDLFLQSLRQSRLQLVVRNEWVGKLVTKNNITETDDEKIYTRNESETDDEKIDARNESETEDEKIDTRNESETIEDDTNSEWETDNEENEVKTESNVSENGSGLSPVY